MSSLDWVKNALDNHVKKGLVLEEWANELKIHLSGSNESVKTDSTHLSDDEWAEKVRRECEAIRNGS
jgi:hypothetical protein